MTQEALSLQTSPIITFGYLMQVLISLVVVLALIYLSAKYLLPKMKMDKAGKFIQILDRTHLEPQVTAYVLKIAKSAWFIIVSNRHISRIDRIDESVNE